MGVDATHISGTADLSDIGLGGVHFDSVQSPCMSAMGLLLAGARARGIADAYGLMGQAAILMDRAGMVLHANDTAAGLFGPHLYLAHRHLLAGSADETRALQAAIAAAIGAAALPGRLQLAGSGATGPLLVEFIPFPGAAADENQLLKAIVLLQVCHCSA